YLKVDELLELQQLQSKPQEHDEMLFIIIHQTYELWFKQILHESGKLGKNLVDGESWAALKTLRRILTILKTLVGQIDILETMTPKEFISFRGFLENSSGFQSWQFREVEILCGYRSPQAIELQKSVPHRYEQLVKRMAQPTYWETFISFLQKRGHDVASPVAKNESGLIYDPCEQTQAKLAEIFDKDQEAGLIGELLLDFDEGLQEWRYRHVKMVERTIGSKMGTGGSPGAAYLHKTLNKAAFPDLWAVRNLV
ncbi:MAG: tryptophan 2,3-dioxygenase family protein, partial [Gammaproteobacteria bacterium]|nr:tryptophan 2,3-dioxygenase family protein [Gammaproteobacteria bacterium]